ncbi:hypothetical protein ACKFKF_01270 [Phormidesmis sp. 146-12]
MLSLELTNSYHNSKPVTQVEYFSKTWQVTIESKPFQADSQTQKHRKPFGWYIKIDGWKVGSREAMLDR